MATETNVNNLVINVLSKQQFDSIAQKSDTELYLVPDVYDNVPTVGSTNPVTSNGVYNALTEKRDFIKVQNHGTSDSTFTLTPNVYHMWGEMASLTLSLGTPSNSDILNEYVFEFKSGSTPTTLSLPATISWSIDLTPVSNKIYQVSIVNNIGLWVSIDVES